MELNQVLRLFAVGAVAANVATLVVLWRTWRGRGARRSSRGRFGSGSLRWRALVGTAAALALVATLGSLYLSEVAHLVPCRWCWFQRIAMYPLALVLLIAALVRDRGVHRYGLPLCAAGAAMSAWHYLLQHFPNLEGDGTCNPLNPCAIRYAWEFGFVSIPYMAGSVFLAVGALLWLARSYDGG